MTSFTTEMLDTQRRFGAAAALRLIAGNAGAGLLGLQLVEVVWLEMARLRIPLEVEPPFAFRFLSAAEVAHHAQDPGNDLSDRMVQRARDHRDFCFAALAGERLAAFGWYALESIEAEHNFGVAMSYPRNVAYMYKGFTHPDFRGARLHGLGMGLALRNLERFGVNALVSTVGWTNEASMRSCDRLGYERLGRMVTIGDSHHLLYAPRAAIARGVRMGPQADLRRGLTLSGNS
jgi:L-amino acid N-acyltransferase YncA